jgi:hypothetical protein
MSLDVVAGVHTSSPPVGVGVWRGRSMPWVRAGGVSQLWWRRWRTQGQRWDLGPGEGDQCRGRGLEVLLGGVVAVERELIVERLALTSRG